MNSGNRTKRRRFQTYRVSAYFPKWMARIAVPSAAKLQIRLFLVALAVSVTQIILATISSRGYTWHERYINLWTFDGAWYADVVDFGYRTTTPPGAGAQYNVAFFPGYPLAAKGLATLFNLSTPVALLLTAQLGALVFWWALLRLLTQWGVRASVAAAAVMLIFCQPGAFYLVVTYAESLFFAFLLVFLSTGPIISKSVMSLVIAAVAGYAMSATRILGAPLAVLPALWAFNELRTPLNRPLRRGFVVSRLFSYGLLSVITALGAISFFIYCAIHFGHWNEYMRAGKIGWSGSHTDLSAFLSAHKFKLFFPGFWEGFVNHYDVTRLYVPVFTLGLIALPALDAFLSYRGYIDRFAERLVFYLIAVLMFAITASSGVTPSNPYTVGLIRYAMYTYIPLILAAAHAHCSSKWRERELPVGTQILVFLVCAIGLALQLQFCWRYARAVFVA